jgi:hypothetical protein
MSRTDVHRPYQVQINDPDNRHQLYTYPAYPSGTELTPTYGTCGCPMCTGQGGRKVMRRRERVLWRAQRQDLLKTMPEDYEDIDVFVRPADAWF